MMIGTVGEADDYHAARGNAAWADASEQEREQALLRASDHIRFRYVQRFAPQYDETSPNVPEATYEAALFELQTPGFFSVTYTPSQQKVLSAAGPIRWEVIGKKGGFEQATPVSTKIEDMLWRYIGAWSGITGVMTV